MKIIHQYLFTPGHNQSPCGILATTSTRPYLNENELCVLKRALLTGLIITSPPA